MKNNLIGISGKLGSGKDTVGLIIQYLQTIKNYPNDEVGDFHWFLNMTTGEQEFDSRYKIKKFADKLKDITCMLIGCTREQLENREFKEKELGEEWDIFKESVIGSWATKEEAYTHALIPENVYKEKLTPRKLLQLLGTDAGRDIIHPNIWVNSLMSGYKRTSFLLDNGVKARGVKYPNWIVTDMRFPNELAAIKAKGGITIRIERPGMESHCGGQHPSETALDSAEFDIVINNDGTLEDLIEKVKNLSLV